MPNIFPDTEWLRLRLGKITSSKIDVLFTEPRSAADKKAGNLSEGAKTYISECACEILTGTFRDIGKLPTLEWGKQYEPEAAELLSQQHEGFQYFGGENPKFLPLTDYSGGSPDAIVEFPAKVCFEIKCPENPSNHLEFLQCENGNDLKELERKYWSQLQMNVACLAKHIGCKIEEVKGVFVSYSPLFGEKIKMKTIDIYPDKEFHEQLQIKIAKAETELKKLVLKFYS